MTDLTPSKVEKVEELASHVIDNHGREIEKLATAYARSGPDHSDLTARGIRGIFYDTLELAMAQQWASRIGLRIASDTLTENHRWLGAVPEPRAHFGGLNAAPVNNYALAVTNEDYELTVPFSLHDFRRDKTGHIARKIGELATAWADHWNKLAVDVFEDNDTAYDGTALFATTHAIGSSGTIDNALVAGTLGQLNITDADNPTKAEAAAILAGLAAHMWTYKDDAGRPCNQGAQSFVAVVHPNVFPGFQSAIKDELYVQGGSNELRGLGLTFDLVVEPRLASDTVGYFARTDGGTSKPLILQSELEPTLQTVGPDSEHAIKNNQVLYVSKACRAVAPGEFRQVIKFTMS